MTKENIVKAPVSRKRRTAMENRNILSFEDKDPNFEYRIVNDTPGRVEDLTARGYDHVANGKVGSNRVERPSVEGSPTKIHVGGGNHAYLMRIPKEYYEEDQAVKQAEVDRTEATMKPDGTYGKLDVTRR